MKIQAVQDRTFQAKQWNLPLRSTEQAVTVICTYSPTMRRSESVISVRAAVSLKRSSKLLRADTLFILRYQRIITAGLLIISRTEAFSR